jgi:drug/metabolite transporter (DMT)-like permease
LSLDSSSEVEVEQDSGSSKKQLGAAAQAVFVTILWASSWVIIKFGIEQENLPPLTFSGLRYTVASVILLVVILSRAEYRQSAKTVNRRWFGILVVYGIIFVSITQGAQFVGLYFLEAITVSILLNLTPILVLLIGAMSLREKPSHDQIGLILLGVFGAMLYFYPFSFAGESLIGIIIMLIGVFANALSSVLGRYINRERVVHPVVVTGISMTVGSSLLLGVGLMIEEQAGLTPLAIVYILWLSVVNTAFAFTLWHKAMQRLRAVDSTIINSTMLPQIVLLSIIFLGEMPGLLDWFGLAILAMSVALVQISQARRENNQAETSTESST